MRQTFVPFSSLPPSTSLPTINLTPHHQPHSPPSTSLPTINLTPHHQPHSPPSTSLPTINLTPHHQPHSPPSTSLPTITQPLLSQLQYTKHHPHLNTPTKHPHCTCQVINTIHSIHCKYFYQFPFYSYFDLCTRLPKGEDPSETTTQLASWQGCPSTTPTNPCHFLKTCMVRNSKHGRWSFMTKHISLSIEN